MSFDEFLGMEAKLIYLMAVLIIASYLLFWGLWVIRREKRRRLDQVKEMDYTEAVLADPAHPEEIDIDSHNVINRKHAVQGIESRFEFMQKFYIPLVLFITILLVGLPFLPALPATYLSLLTGVIAGIIGLAARPVIENAIAGMVLTFSQPIRINDTVILDGQYGTVEKINLLHTTIKIWNWRRLVIPNNKLLEKEIENLTLGDESEWAYMPFMSSLLLISIWLKSFPKKP